MQLYTNEQKNSIAVLQIDKISFVVLTKDEKAGDRKIACTAKRREKYVRIKKFYKYI